MVKFINTATKQEIDVMPGTILPKEWKKPNEAVEKMPEAEIVDLDDPKNANLQPADEQTKEAVEESEKTIPEGSADEKSDAKTKDSAKK